MKTKIQKGIIFILIGSLLTFSACARQEELTEGEKGYVGRWELTDITYTANSVQLRYPAEGNSGLETVFNEVCSKYWEQTIFLFSGDKKNEKLEGSLQIGEEIKNFTWSGNKEYIWEIDFSENILFSKINENTYTETLEEATLLLDAKGEKLIVGTGSATMLYYFTKA